MLRLVLDGSGTARLVGDDDVTVADGHVCPSEGAEFLINATGNGRDVSLELRFVGKVVNT